jgi:hypothetical protein
LSEDSRRETIISWLAFEDIFFLLTTPRFVVNDDDVTAIFLPYYRSTARGCDDENTS